MSKIAKKSQEFECKSCDYITSNKYDYKKHCETIKHKNRCLAMFSNEKIAKNRKTYNCVNCNKIYNDYSGLWRHKQKCMEETQKIIEDINSNTNTQTNEVIQLNEIVENNKIVQNNEITELKDFIKYLMKDNSEMKGLMTELVKNGINKNYNHYNNTTISNNKTFNLNMFLNETCKNAMNISDFMNSIHLDLSDLENVGELGYVNGISNIIVKNLKALDITQRPIHCTDAKREILYVKDEDKWEKDNEQNNKLDRFVRDVANKNIRMLNEYKKKYPDCIKSDSNKSDQYNKLVIEAMGGQGFNYDEQHKKIIKRISKEVTIDKVIL